MALVQVDLNIGGTAEHTDIREVVEGGTQTYAFTKKVFIPAGTVVKLRIQQLDDITCVHRRIRLQLIRERMHN